VESEKAVLFDRMDDFCLMNMDAPVTDVCPSMRSQVATTGDVKSGQDGQIVGYGAYSSGYPQAGGGGHPASRETVR
jgi:hypothetical protein